MEREIKIGDWGWFWDSDTDKAMYGELRGIKHFELFQFHSTGKKYLCFSHEHPTGKFKIVETAESKPNPESLIGKKVKGFKFEDMKYNNPGYIPSMDRCIGEIGCIVNYHETSDRYTVRFSDGDWWKYPAELIEQHLVEEDPYTELKKAYAEGKTIQLAIGNGEWEDITLKHTMTFRSHPKNYRIKPEPKYVPYTFEDRDEFRGKWIRSNTDYTCEHMITGVSESVVSYGDGLAWDYMNLFLHFEYIDGTPFGKLIN